MRGLALFTLNSTYLIDGDQIMWVPNDRTRLSQSFGEDVMDASVWYTLVRKPEMPTYDWANIQGTDMTSVSFTFAIYRFNEEPVYVPVITSRLYNYAYLGDGESYKWRTAADDLISVKDMLREHYAEHGARVDATGTAYVNRKPLVVKKVMKTFGVNLSTALDYVNEASKALFTIKVEINDSPLADWERELLTPRVNEY